MGLAKHFEQQHPAYVAGKFSFEVAMLLMGYAHARLLSTLPVRYGRSLDY